MGQFQAVHASWVRNGEIIDCDGDGDGVGDEGAGGEYERMKELRSKMQDVKRDGREYEFVVVGSEECVEVAKRGLLVMMDELVSL